MFRYFCHLNALYMFIYCHAHIAKRAYILLLMYTYKCLHISTAIYALCISTYFCAHIPTHAYMLLRLYNFASLHTSTPTLLYLQLHILCPYSSYTFLHTSTPLFAQYMFKYFYAHIFPYNYVHMRPLHVYILLRPYTYSYIHTHI